MYIYAQCAIRTSCSPSELISSNFSFVVGEKLSDTSINPNSPDVPTCCLSIKTLICTSYTENISSPWFCRIGAGFGARTTRACWHLWELEQSKAFHWNEIYSIFLQTETAERADSVSTTYRTISIANIRRRKRSIGGDRVRTVMDVTDTMNHVSAIKSC